MKKKTQFLMNKIELRLGINNVMKYINPLFG